MNCSLIRNLTETEIGRNQWSRSWFTYICRYVYVGLLTSLHRFVDDTFSILSKDFHSHHKKYIYLNYINDFKPHFNSICLHIQFTIQKEHNFSLDVRVKRDSRNGSTTTTHSLLSATIYRKPTHTPTDIFTTSHITPNIVAHCCQKPLYTVHAIHPLNSNQRYLMEFRKVAMCNMVPFS